MSSARQALRSAPVFAALGNETRLRLVTRLGDGASQSITELTSGLDLTRQGVTKHLRILEEAGMVTCRREGREARYTLRPAPIARARDYLTRASAQWDEAIERLRARVEE